MCYCTYIGNECLICEQNSAYTSSLNADRRNNSEAGSSTQTTPNSTPINTTTTTTSATQPTALNINLPTQPSAASNINSINNNFHDHDYSQRIWGFGGKCYLSINVPDFRAIIFSLYATPFSLPGLRLLRLSQISSCL